MGSSSAPPPAPNPQKTIKQQTAANLETAKTQQELNAMDQTTPFGNLNYTFDPVTGKGTATQTLSPTEQGIFNQWSANRGTAGQISADQLAQLQSMLGKPVDLSNDAVEQHLFDLAMKRLEPQLARDLNSRETTLMNRGIMPGTEQYARELQRYDQSRNDLYNQLALTGRQQSIAEILAGRNQPIQEFLALQGYGTPQMPNWINTPQVAMKPTDVAGITQQAYQNQYQQWQQQQAQQNAMMGGLMGLGGTVIGGALGGPFGASLGGALGGWAGGGSAPLPYGSISNPYGGVQNPTYF